MNPVIRSPHVDRIYVDSIYILPRNDSDFAADTVVLTGSSAARLHEVRKALAGRRGSVTNSDRTLLPMRFTDVVTASGLSLPTVPAIRRRISQTPTYGNV
jgi:hypothetical protein